MNSRSIWRPLTAAALLALGACSKAPQNSSAQPAAASNGKTAEQAGKGEAHEENENARSVKMSDAALDAAGIRVAVVQPSVAGEQLRAPGEVLDNAYGTTLITPRVEALVVRREAKLGDEVRAGTPLVTLASVAVSDAQAELRVAEQEWRRVSELGPEAVSGRRIGEAKVALDRARAKAQAYGLPGASAGTVNGQFTLSAPHEGRITEDNFVVGERIEPGRTLYRLVDESIVWVDAKLPAGAAPRIVVGSPATIVIGDRRISGKVLRTAHRTSEATRNAVVRIEVPNPDDRLHGGDFVDVYLDAEAGAGSRGALAVPTAALVQFQGDSVVFRKNAGGVIEAVPVRTGAVIGDTTIVAEGISPGDAVVVAGAFALKAQLLKAQLGEGDGH
ncbi:MAG: efflux RND transporter periplasmic adaptor subunit [Rudaea sp.]|uniref:efflux RND transporter periplasmic adaptor subunit n=1 Tax=unclassified Rudaea TaxID=2627037 RepID=UPI0014850519|nr:MULTISPECIES: efflux RND transporter periplasmic adaptor subunit [unclassified Rudaea]MBN8885568.1 efflux RND transporter periplasmic adaptor subunit [Rudaea sp.]